MRRWGSDLATGAAKLRKRNTPLFCKRTATSPERVRLGEAARQRVVANFGIAQAVAAYESLYRELAA